FDDTNQLAARAFTAAGAHGKEVGYTRDAAAHPVGGGQHQRLVQVLPADFGFALRSNDEVAALLPIEHAAETTVGIKAGETAPVHGTGAGNQRCGMAITDQCVVGDGRVRMRGTSYSDEAPRRLLLQDSSEITF